METKQNILTFKIDTKEPIDITDLTESLKAIGELYHQSVGGEGAIKISEVRKGSYEFDFIATALPLFMEHTNTAAEFIKNVKGIICFITDFFSKDTIDDNLSKPTISQIENANKIIQPITNINGDNNTINIYSNDDNKQQIIINQKQAKEFKANSELYIKQQPIEQELEKSESLKFFTDKIIEFTQTRDDSKKGTKAICKNFSEKEINVEFTNNFIRDSIFKKDDNPHLFHFVVDLEVEFKDKQPSLYKIIAIRDKKSKSQDQRLPFE